METIEKKTRRRRRTKIEVENAIWEAFERLITQKGFHKLTIVELAQEAQVEPQVLYNRFENLSDIIDRYLLQRDYWLNDNIKIDYKTNPKNCLKKIAAGLINDMYGNEIMQQVLIWELSNSSEASREMAQMREKQYKPLYDYLNEHLQGTQAGTKAIIALMIAGVYYLILHRRISTFGLINFDTEHGKQLLIGMVEELIGRLFIEKGTKISFKAPKTMREVAKNMLDLGVTTNTVATSTGLTLKEVTSLLSKDLTIEEIDSLKS